MKRSSLVLLVLISGCGGKDDAASIGAASIYEKECANSPSPPDVLECTGLYTNLQTKALASGVRSYAPAVPLWADGAGKDRFILLPPGTTIDRTNPSEWKFPIGTKIWKEFSRDGKRVETRWFNKVAATEWIHATYQWNQDDTAAAASVGGDIAGPGGAVYHIPTWDECEDCHRGRNDRILGFEEVSLGLEVKSASGDVLTATGTTLADLASSHLLTPEPTRTKLEIGDDGTGLDAFPLAWIHINCGTTCHNTNSSSIGYGAKMPLRLDPTQLDGRSAKTLDPLVNTLGVSANSASFHGQIRIVPGDPSSSLLLKLISQRVSQGASVQMPPIATLIPDSVDDTTISQWIAKMPPSATADGATPPTGTGMGPTGNPSGAVPN